MRPSFLRLFCAVALGGGALLYRPAPALAQSGKREVMLPRPGRLAGMPLPAPAPSIAIGPFGLSVPPMQTRARELVLGPTDPLYIGYEPRRHDPGAAPVTALYAKQFDALRQLELRAGAVDTAAYAVSFQNLYHLRRDASGEYQATKLAQLPFSSKALCKGPNGDLYLASAAGPDARTLYRFDPRARRLFRSNLALPRLLDGTDEWLSAAAYGDRLYLLNSAGNNLVELAPGRVPRNLLAGALQAKEPPGFVGKILNMTVGPDGTFYLKENFSPTLWMFTERNGELRNITSVDLTWAGTTGAIAVLPGPGGARAWLLLGEFVGAPSRLMTYDLATRQVREAGLIMVSDLALTAVPKAAPRGPGTAAATLNGWFRGALYVDQTEQPTFELHFQPGGRLDSVAFRGRSYAVAWHYRQRGELFDISADSTFTDYVAWYGGGRRAGAGAATTLTVALQSSVFDALNEVLGAAGPVPFGFSAGTEGFAELKPAASPPPPPAPPVAVMPPPPVVPAPDSLPVVPPVPDPVTVTTPPPRPSTKSPRVSDSLTCDGADILIEVADYNVVDGDQVQFFFGEKPITGILTLRRRAHKFHLPCPDSSGLLIMKTINAGQGPCTARLTIHQGKSERQLRLQSTIAQSSAVKFFRR